MKKKLNLPNVTLLAATSIDIDQTQLALRISLQNISFGAVKLLSSAPPKKKYSDIEYVSIPSINFLDYSRLIIEDLHKYFKTSHCLIVQADSFVVNASLWKEEFLKYDYIVLRYQKRIMEKRQSIRALKLLKNTEKLINEIEYELNNMKEQLKNAYAWRTYFNNKMLKILNELQKNNTKHYMY